MNKVSKKFSIIGKISSFSIIFIILVILIAPLFIPYEPNSINLENKFSQISSSHFLGSDHLGRDIATRLIYGARLSLSAAFITLSIIIFLGISIGGICGFIGGRLDRFVMRICDFFFSVPTIVLSLFFVGILGSGLINVIIAIALTHWAWYARIVRSIIFNLKNKEFVVLSRIYGASHLQSFRRNMLIPILMQCVVLATMDIGHIILHIAGLSFLGLGVQPPESEWGVMLSDSKEFLWSNPELLIYPGVALFITIALFNLFGDSLRDYFDIDLKDFK
ncbi:nickel ABC transporter permease subunit NikC [Helicobacter sp. MIT 14-3879]|uniref:nickel ABC transporter permease subunit NikC n=1 Tax=Helicobacter sp. MIT 14-3879 TaxID=2040649 RepID=UPI000E1F930F|nr:nickel ABC transporter permease subunit NikC [Helicobacter sp. MIT 14-3879]RDU61697.1 nickel ABC transporter permease subunit NikC [Helicobacter sp. MIT 14-3879]